MALEGGQVAVLRLHAASASHVTKASYSRLRGVYVRYGTKVRLFIKEAPNFFELRHRELRRIYLPRTSVNKGIKRGPEDGFLQRRVLGDLFITRSTVV